MANRKRICVNCKERFPVESGTIRPVGFFHSIECQVEYGRKNGAKARIKAKDKEFKEIKRRVKAESLKTRKRAAKEACHLYIRTRDKDQPCICCGKPLLPDFHAGHFFESGNNPKIRYDESNINGQNLQCNYFKDGGDYETNLVEKVGKQEVNRLRSLKGGVVKRTAEDYREIELYFKDKLLEITEC